AIAALCSRAILLQDGRLALDGDTSTVLTAYQNARPCNTANDVSVAEKPRQGTGKGRFSALTVVVVDRSGQVLTSAVPGCDALVGIQVDCVADFFSAQVAMVLFDANGYRVLDVNTALRGEFLSLKQGESAAV